MSDARVCISMGLEMGPKDGRAGPGLISSEHVAMEGAARDRCLPADLVRSNRSRQAQGRGPELCTGPRGCNLYSFTIHAGLGGHLGAM